MADSNGMQIRFLLIPAGVLLALVGGALVWRRFNPAPAVPGQTAPAAPAAEPSALAPDTVLVTVNGEPVFEKDVAMALPAGTSAADIAWVRRRRIERRVAIAACRQFLAANSISVPDDFVKKAVDDLRKNPPSLGCPCCRFPSLEAFLTAQYLTLEELRDEIRNNEGFRRHAEAKWEADYPAGPKRTACVRAGLPKVQREYAKLYQIFFNTFQQPDYAADPEAVRARTLKKAEAAEARLQQGQQFQDVAKDVSEDYMSRPAGGDLGCIAVDTFGDEFAKQVSALKPGGYTQPFLSPWGYHIALREELSEADALGVLEAEYVRAKLQECRQAAEQEAKIRWLAEPKPQ